MLVRAPEARREVLLQAFLVRSPELRGMFEYKPEIVVAASPYPKLEPDLAARLLLGESPAAISGLTRVEAHHWLLERGESDPPLTPAEWLVMTVGLDQYQVQVASVPVARWLVAVMRDPVRREALTREREERGPHGEIARFKFSDRLDLLRDSDLRDSVLETFTRMVRRLTAARARLQRKKGEPLAAPPHWWRPMRGARLLLSEADLAIEGQEMRHCVGFYGPYVKEGRSVIVALNILGHRSTAEIERATMYVRQHMGPENKRPHPLNVKALAVYMRRWQSGLRQNPLRW